MADLPQLSKSDQSREQSVLLRLRMRALQHPIIILTSSIVFSLILNILEQGSFTSWLALGLVMVGCVVFISLFVLVWRLTNPVLISTEGISFRSAFAKKTYVSWRAVTNTRSTGSFTPFINFFCDGSKKRSARIHILYFTDPEFTKFVQENKIRLPSGMIEILAKAEGKSPKELPEAPSIDDN